MAATVEIELETGEPGEEDDENEGDVGEVPSQLLVGSDQINSSSSNYQQVLSDNLPSSFSLSFLLTSCCCCFQQINDKKAALVITTGVLYYFAIGLTSISLSLLINQRIAGHAEHPNSDSVFVQSTVVFIHSTTSFIIGRYTSGLGDYLGRKPVLIASSLVCILSRYVYYSAHTPQVFYLAAILSGCLDLYYFSSLAWICDLFPEGPQRSKRVGLFSGTVGGLTLTIAAPLGAILAKYVSPGFPFVISPLLSLACTLLLLVMPVEDTLGAKKDPTALFYLTSNRALPANWNRYLLSHFPISFGALEVIKKAKHPLDWLTNFLMHITTSIMLMIFIQYLFVVFHWSAPLASGAVLFVGFCLGVFAPTLLHRYNPIPLAFYAMGFYTLGLTLLSIAGTGLERTESLGVIGIICLGFGISWVPALQSNLTSQYGSDIQGTHSPGATL
jgi:MFS family permease